MVKARAMLIIISKIRFDIVFSIVSHILKHELYYEKKSLVQILKTSKSGNTVSGKTYSVNRISGHTSHFYDYFQAFKTAKFKKKLVTMEIIN